MSEAKKIATAKIQQLLEESSLQAQDLPLEYQNYSETIEKLRSSRAVINFLNQMQKIIAQQCQTANQRVDNLTSLPKNDQNLPLFLWGLGMIIAGSGGLIVLLISHFKKVK